MAKPVEPLSIDSILCIHSLVMRSSGGFYAGDAFDVLNKGSLEYVLEASLFPVFGQLRYPSVFDKAGALANTIICAHVFRDGNKRTALACCKALCHINGYTLVVDKAAEDFFVRIAEEKLSWEKISAWLKSNAKIDKSHDSWQQTCRN